MLRLRQELRKSKGEIIDLYGFIEGGGLWTSKNHLLSAIQSLYWFSSACSGLLSFSSLIPRSGSGELSLFLHYEKVLLVLVFCPFVALLSKGKSVSLFWTYLLSFSLD